MSPNNGKPYVIVGETRLSFQLTLLVGLIGALCAATWKMNDWKRDVEALIGKQDVRFELNEARIQRLEDQVQFYQTAPPSVTR